MHAKQFLVAGGGRDSLNESIYEAWYLHSTQGDLQRYDLRTLRLTFGWPTSGIY